MLLCVYTFLLVHHLARLSCFVFVASETGASLAVPVRRQITSHCSHSYIRTVSSNVALLSSSRADGRGFITCSLVSPGETKASRHVDDRLLHLRPPLFSHWEKMKKKKKRIHFLDVSHISRWWRVSLLTNIWPVYWRCEGSFKVRWKWNVICTSQEGPEDWGRRSRPSKRMLSFSSFHFW